jgi:biopolymer transport protein ExbD
MAGFVASRASARNVEPNAEPNVIPFIDVLLVLLVIFMVTAPTPTTDINFDPARFEGVAPSDMRPTIVSVLRGPNGVRFVVDDQESGVAELAAITLEHARANNPTLPSDGLLSMARIYVRADMDVPYEAVVAAMDTLNGARFQRVGVFAQDADGA